MCVMLIRFPISYFLNVKRMRTPGLKMAAVKIQHKNCLQSTLRKKKINTLFAGLGRSVLGKTVPSVLSTALGLRPWPYSRPLAQFFPIWTSRPANNIYVHCPGEVCIEAYRAYMYLCFQELKQLTLGVHCTN